MFVDVSSHRVKLGFPSLRYLAISGVFPKPLEPMRDVDIANSIPISDIGCESTIQLVRYKPHRVM